MVNVTVAIQTYKLKLTVKSCIPLYCKQCKVILTMISADIPLQSIMAMSTVLLDKLLSYYCMVTLCMIRSLYNIIQVMVSLVESV